MPAPALAVGGPGRLVRRPQLLGHRPPAVPAGADAQRQPGGGKRLAGEDSGGIRARHQRRRVSRRALGRGGGRRPSRSGSRPADRRKTADEPVCGRVGEGLLDDH